RHPMFRESCAHRLDLAHPHADARASELDGKADLAHFHAPADVVGFDLFSAASFNAGGFVGHTWIGERTANHAWPYQFVRLKCRSGADIRLGIEAQTHHLENLAHRPNHRRVEMFLAQAVKAGITLHAFVGINGRALDFRVDVDGAHRADISA